MDAYMKALMDEAIKEMEIQMQTTIAELLANSLINQTSDGFRLTDEGMRQAEVVWRKLPNKDKLLLTCYLREILVLERRE